MGFKCPHCHKDFGTDMREFKKHLAENFKCNLYTSSFKQILDDAIENINTKTQDHDTIDNRN